MKTPIIRKPETPRKMRMRKVAKLLIESGGTKSVSGAMRESGVYSVETAKNPNKITKSKLWAEVMEEYLPQDEFAKAHKKLLNAKTPVLQEHTFIGGVDDKTIRELIESMADCHLISIKNIFKNKVDEDGEEIEDDGEEPVSFMRVAYYSAPDNRARKDAIDMGYKLLGVYSAEKHVVGVFSLANLRKVREQIENPKTGV